MFAILPPPPFLPPQCRKTGPPPSPLDREGYQGLPAFNMPHEVYFRCLHIKPNCVKYGPKGSNLPRLSGEEVEFFESHAVAYTTISSFTALQDRAGVWGHVHPPGRHGFLFKGAVFGVEVHRSGCPTILSDPGIDATHRACCRSTFMVPLVTYNDTFWKGTSVNLLRRLPDESVTILEAVKAAVRIPTPVPAAPTTTSPWRTKRKTDAGSGQCAPRQVAGYPLPGIPAASPRGFPERELRCMLWAIMC